MKVLNDKGKIAIDELFTNGFDRPSAYAKAFPTSTRKTRAGQMYQLLKRPEAGVYYDEKYKEYSKLLGVDKTILVASLIKQVEYFNEVMQMSADGCPIKNPTKDAQIEEDIDEWWNRYGRMKDIVKASDVNAAKNMIAKLIGAFEPEKIVVEEITYSVGFDFGKDDDIQDAKEVE